MAVPGNISVTAGVSAIGTIPLAVNQIDDPVLFATPLYKYANLDLPFSPNDPGLQFTWPDPLIHKTLAARFFNLLNEYSNPLFLGGLGTVQPVNPPIIFEPPLRMCLSGLPELWCVVSDSDPTYAGCYAFMSTDDGQSFNPPADITGSSAIPGNATTGYVASAGWVAHADVDADDPLTVDLTESQEGLVSYVLADENNFRYPCYVGPSGFMVSAGIVPTASGAMIYNICTSDPGCDGVSYSTPLHCDFALVAGKSSGAPGGLWVRSAGESGFLVGPECCGQQPMGFLGALPGGTPPRCGIGNPCITVDEAGLLFPGSFFGLGDQGLFPQVGAIGVSGSAGVASFAHEPTSAGGGIPPLTLDGVTFPGSPGNSLTTQSFGGDLFLIRCKPKAVGGVSLFIAIGAGLVPTGPGYLTIPGWTFIGGGGNGTAYQGSTIGIGAWKFTGSNNVLDLSASGYELMAYQQVNPVSGFVFTMPAASGMGGPLRRAVFSQPIAGMGVGHPIGTRFAWLNDRLVNKPVGILKIPLDSAWIGLTLLFRFGAFNTLGAIEDPSTLSTYAYTPTGLAFAQFSSQPTYIQAPSQALSQTDANDVAMATVTESFAGNLIRYNARTFSGLPTPPALGQTYYVTIFDPFRLGDVGQALTQPAFIDSTQVRVELPGYIYIGSIVIYPSGFNNAIVTPGGWPPGDVTLVNGT